MCPFRKMKTITIRTLPDIYIYIYMCVCVCVCVFIYLYIYIYIYIYVCVCVFSYLSMYIYIYIYMCVCVCVCVRTRHAGQCWRNKSDVPLRNLSHEWAGVWRPVRTYLQQLCTDTGCSLEDLPNAMDKRDECGGRVRVVCTRGTTWSSWWWWRWCLYTYICLVWFGFFV